MGHEITFEFQLDCLTPQAAMGTDISGLSDAFRSLSCAAVHIGALMVAAAARIASGVPCSSDISEDTAAFRARLRLLSVHRPDTGEPVSLPDTGEPVYLRLRLIAPILVLSV